MSFDYTVEGCVAAKKWLCETNNLWRLDREPSQDGYTIVCLANRIKERDDE